MVDYDYDVCIVGGGPSGVITALSVAREDYSCVILDKKPREKIGDKVCGDALDGMHTKLLEENMGIEPPSLERGEARDLIKTITFAAGDISSKLSANVPGYQVDRLAYGQRLLREAEKEGVIIKGNSPVRGVIIEDDQVVGVNYFDENREKQELRAKITVDASGYVGNVRKEIPADMTQGIKLDFDKEWSIGTYREIVELDWEQDHQFREEILLLYHKDIPPPGYAWIFSEGEKKLNIGITWVKSEEYPDDKSMKTIYHDILDQYIDPDTYTVIHRGGGNIPMRPNFDTLVFNGGLIVGDAGGLADPTTFEGHGPALESGRIAAQTITNALELESYREEDLWSYNKDIQEYPGGMHAQSFLVARLIRDLGVENVQFMLNRKLVTEDELNTMFREEKPLSLWTKFKAVMKAFPKWGILFRLKEQINQIEEIGEVYEQYPESPEGFQEWREKRNEVLGYNF